MTAQEHTFTVQANTPDGIEIRDYHEGRLYTFHATMINRVAVDAFWERAIRQREWCLAYDQPLLMAYQFDRITLSPYARQMNTQNLHLFHNLSGRLAIVYNHSQPLLNFMGTYIRREMERNVKLGDCRDFGKLEAALEWLEAGLPDHA